MLNLGKKRNYLEEARYQYHNMDYIEFLVHKVWKISRPVNLVDVGCGIGYLGLMVLPFLPDGSTYTGVDLSDVLVEQAIDVYRDTSHSARFIQASGYELPFEDNAFDTAACQAFLMHLSEPERAVAEMIRVTAPGGLVIAAETNWNASSSLQSIAGLDLADTTDLGFLQKNHELNRKSSGRDGNIGIKLPALFHELGLKNVGSRISDMVKCILPPVETGNQEPIYKTVAQEIGRTVDEDTAKLMEAHFIKLGFSKEEARAQTERDQTLNHTFRDKGLETITVWGAAMSFSFGWVDGTEKTQSK